MRSVERDSTHILGAAAPCAWLPTTWARAAGGTPEPGCGSWGYRYRTCCSCRSHAIRQGAWLATLPGGAPEQCHWEDTGARRWGSGLWVRDGRLTPLTVPQAYRGRVVAAVVEGLTWPVLGASPVVAMSIHAPTAKGSSYIKEVGRILDLVPAIAAGLPVVLGGDFNVAVALRASDHALYNSPGERTVLARMRDELGLLPCWQSAHPDEEPARTLRWMRRRDSLPYHCDGLFVPAAWIPSLIGCEVLEDDDWCALSDHNPVVATFASA